MITPIAQGLVQAKSRNNKAKRYKKKKHQSLIAEKVTRALRVKVKPKRQIKKKKTSIRKKKTTRCKDIFG